MFVGGLSVGVGSSPHTRGAPRYRPGTPGRPGGSSPHTRGARRCRSSPRYPWGIIPAYAGSTTSPPKATSRLPDHPRIRGEHVSVQFPKGKVGGSSPHTRGALYGQETGLDRDRIIPAYAGSTQATLRWRRSLPDHPRIRGEHLGAPQCDAGGLGSSPHTRGALTGVVFAYPTSRIIPAYAGSTHFSFPFSRSGADHPRIRGEHTTTRYAAHKVAGSSPHTRGAR